MLCIMVISGCIHLLFALLLEILSDRFVVHRVTEDMRYCSYPHTISVYIIIFIVL